MQWLEEFRHGLREWRAQREMKLTLLNKNRDSGDAYYILTGVDVHGKRFRKTSDNRWYLEAHNVWRGTLWQASRSRSGRKRLKRWWN